MNDLSNLRLPEAYNAIQAETRAMGFGMISELLTGSLLKTLAATKPNASFLELGTGTGASAAWLLDGMDQNSRLVSVENDEAALAVARKHLGHDLRVTFVLEDAGLFLERQEGQVDFIFADTWPGKYTHLDEALRLLKPGGFYIIDDMLPQENWPEDHPPKVKELIRTLDEDPSLYVTKLSWASGVITVTKPAA